MKKFPISAVSVFISILVLGGITLYAGYRTQPSNGDISGFQPLPKSWDDYAFYHDRKEEGTILLLSHVKAISSSCAGMEIAVEVKKQLDSYGIMRILCWRSDESGMVVFKDQYSKLPISNTFEVDPSLFIRFKTPKERELDELKVRMADTARQLDEWGKELDARIKAKSVRESTATEMDTTSRQIEELRRELNNKTNTPPAPPPMVTCTTLNNITTCM